MPGLDRSLETCPDPGRPRPMNVGSASRTHRFVAAVVAQKEAARTVIVRAALLCSGGTRRSALVPFTVSPPPWPSRLARASAPRCSSSDRTTQRRRSPRSPNVRSQPRSVFGNRTSLAFRGAGSVGGVGGAFSGCVARVGQLIGRGIAGEQGERVVGRRAGLGDVDAKVLDLV